tara:strand:- start:350 stop:667 length:318 start_codon:yes stop_codon:yes gene_type:complete
LKEVQELGYGVAQITHDAPDKLKAFGDSAKIGFTMLADDKAIIIPAFGVENPQFKKGSAWYGVAHPIIFAVDPDGTIRHRFSQTDYRDRTDIDAILDVLRKDTGS